MEIHCGIDVGEYQLFAAAIRFDGTRIGREIMFADERSVDEVIEWVVQQRPASVGVDAPPGPNLGLLADPVTQRELGIAEPPQNTNRRLAEYMLGIGGYYGTPSDERTAPGWMQTGFDVYRKLADRIDGTIDTGAGGSIFEVHPTYGFRSFLGIERHGAHWLCDPTRLLRPKTPRGSQGHRQRVQVLMGILEHFGGTPDASLQAALLASIDRTDALLGAVLGLMRANGKTLAVGLAPEGVIHVAAPEPELQRIALGRVEVSPGAEPRSSHGRPAPPPRRRTTRADRRAPDDATGFLFRLGANGLGRLSQEQTIERILGLWNGEGQAVIPLGISNIAEQTIERGRREGLTVLVGHGGKLILQLERATIEGRGRKDPTATAALFGDGPNPWPDVAAADYWLLAEDVRRLTDATYDSIETWSKTKRTWVRGVPDCRSAWLTFRRLAD